ncbi:MAG: sulfotransferase, partial [Proteobacteria bacterium]|nr:sulfotransferase [Pseudomonadota bacterium]
CGKTHLEDWGHQSARQALEVLLESVHREGKLTYFGRFALRQFLIAKLCNRLRIIEALKRFPEITRQKIDRPVFITGWYRCGTTYLHNLLATHPELRAPLYWELMHPCPTVDPRKVNSQKLIHKTNLANRIHRYLAPGFNAAHAMPAEKPEECLHLFENAAMGTTAFFITEAKSMAWWLLDQDIGPAYHFYKDQLKLLNWLRPGRRWVLKWPFHLWHLDSLIEAFPDATVIHLHRDPREALPSVCSLAALARSSFCESIDNEGLGKFWLDYCEAGLQRGLTAREKADENQVIDIRYPDLKKNPLSVINQIQNTINLGESDAWTESIQANSKAREKKVPGRHHYAMAQFGLDPNEIQERFSKYIEDYDLIHASGA